MPSVPHYLRFVRALAVVSATLPVPVALVATHLAGCSSGSTGSPYGPETGTRACQTADECGVGSGGVRPALDGGTNAAPDGNLVDASDASDDGGDASDDGGGPTRGTKRSVSTAVGKTSTAPC